MHHYRQFQIKIYCTVWSRNQVCFEKIFNDIAVFSNYASTDDQSSEIATSFQNNILRRDPSIQFLLWGKFESKCIYLLPLHFQIKKPQFWLKTFLKFKHLNVNQLSFFLNRTKLNTQVIETNSLFDHIVTQTNYRWNSQRAEISPCIFSSCCRYSSCKTQRGPYKRSQLVELFLKHSNHSVIYILPGCLFLHLETEQLLNEN